MASTHHIQAYWAQPLQRQVEVPGRGRSSAPDVYNVPEGLCCVQMRKKFNSTFSIKFAIKRHGVSAVMFFYRVKLH